MSTFIDITDYDSTIHREILDSLTRDREDIVEVCEDQAIAEMRSYLLRWYDCDAIFGKTGAERHPLILMYAKDIAVYHIFKVHNPYKISDIRKDAYDRAILWLQGVNKGDLIIDGAERLPDKEQKDNSPWQIASNRLNPSHF